MSEGLLSAGQVSALAHDVEALARSVVTVWGLQGQRLLPAGHVVAPETMAALTDAELGALREALQLIDEHFPDEAQP